MTPRRSARASRPARPHLRRPRARRVRWGRQLRQLREDPRRLEGGRDRPRRRSRRTCSTTRSASRGDVATLKENAQQYHDLAEQSDFDTKKMLADNQEEVAKLLGDAKKTYVDANPAYEEMEGVVAGVPSLADYDVIIDAGSDASDPGERGAVLDQDRGRQDLQAARQPLLPRPRARSTARSRSGRPRPTSTATARSSSARRCPTRASTSPRSRSSTSRPRSSTPPPRSGRPTEQDALTALVVMTPTMSEYFEAWKNSRFIAGDKATEKSFVGASRLQDIADILGGLKLIYANVQPKIAEANQEQADQTGQSLTELEASSRACATRRRTARSSPPRTPTRSAARRRTRPRRSPARSPRPPSS